MEEFRRKVAVITGAASGIGRAIAERCAQEGMKVVLADVEADALARAEEELTASGATVLGVLTDVSQANDVEALAKRTLDTYGAVHLLFNNAGVCAVSETTRPIWESTLADWQWIMGVNLWGVIHGVRFFVPIMIEQNVDCHIVNTASAAGLTTGSKTGLYRTSKHAVVSLSETLYLQLAKRNVKVGVSVLCPGPVRTQLPDAERNRPDIRGGSAQHPSCGDARGLQDWRDRLESGIPPTQVIDCVFSAIREERFYIMTHPEHKARVRTRMEDILEERNPSIQ